MKAAFISVLLVTIGVVEIHGGQKSKSAWGYGKTKGEVLGPADWKDSYPHCGERAQSPINIDTSKVEKSSLGNLKFTFTKVNEPPTRLVGTLANNGHAPTLTIDKPKGTAKISGGPLPGYDEYELQQLHFHFGSEKGKGSEHTIQHSEDESSKKYSGELHLVFYNKKYGLDEATSQDDGLAVIAVFLKWADRTTGKSLEKLARKKISKIEKEDSSVAVTADDKITLEELLPESAMEKFDYWTYKGSLTTPPCCQSVQWIVMKKKIPISEKDLNIFRKLKAKYGFDDGLMRDNNRPTMPQNDRKVFTPVKEDY